MASADLWQKSFQLEPVSAVRKHRNLTSVSDGWEVSTTFNNQKKCMTLSRSVCQPLHKGQPPHPLNAKATHCPRCTLLRPWLFASGERFLPTAEKNPRSHQHSKYVKNTSENHTNLNAWHWLKHVETAYLANTTPLSLQNLWHATDTCNAKDAGSKNA